MPLSDRRSWSFALVTLALAGPPAAAQDVVQPTAAAEEVRATLLIPGPAAMDTNVMSAVEKKEYVRAKRAHLAMLKRLRPDRKPEVKGPDPRIAAAAVPLTQPQAEPAPRDTGAVKVHEDVPLGDFSTAGITGTVCEPSVAVTKRGEIFYTGNWFAAFAKEKARDLKYINPARAFPEVPHKFCCDQVTLYDAEHDLLIWFLQYVNDANANTIRVAVAQGPEGIPGQRWSFYDFSPKSVGGWEKEWFDFPDLAVSKKYLYITSNTFTTVGDRFARAVILRLPLAKLKDRAQLAKADQQVFSRPQSFSYRPTQGVTGNTMYFGAHDFAEFGRKIEVLAWPETDDNLPNVTRATFGIDPWSDDDYGSICKDGHGWLNRADGRMTAAWASGSQVGFAWTAGRAGAFKHPHVRVAVLDVAAGKPTRVAAQPHLHNNNLAFGYPGAAVNSAGQVGIAVGIGGGRTTGNTGINPGVAVGVLDPGGAGVAMSWKLTTVVDGKNTIGPPDHIWGDYMSVRPDPRGDGTGFVASSFTLPDKLENGTTNVEDVVPRFIRFSTTADAPPPKKEDPVPGTPAEIQAKAQKLFEAADKLRTEADELLRLLGKMGPKTAVEAKPMPRETAPKKE